MTDYTEREAALAQELDDIKNVDDEVESDESAADLFTISSFGVDYTVEFLVKKIRSRQFYIPHFQRKYVWSKNQASRFIESLLLGLPVPGIFLFKESESQKHLVIDGQQRLKSVRFFYDGLFNDKKFRLSGLKSKWDGLAYDELEEDDRLRLDDGVIHTTVFKQELPQEGMDSVYEVFERINTGGVKLSSQEIRSCILYGEFNDLLFELNARDSWREVYGPESVRLKDIELILRFFAFWEWGEEYKRPVTKFFSDYMERRRNPGPEMLQRMRSIFCDTIDLVHAAAPQRAFRPERALNTAFYDSFCVACAEAVDQDAIDVGGVASAYEELARHDDYKAAISSSTAGEESVTNRFRIAREVVARYVAA